MEKAEIRKIGRKKGLVGRQLSDFVNLIQKRFPNEGCSSYVAEWAGRFKDGVEWFRGDLKTRSILRKINSPYYKKLLKAEKAERLRFKKNRGFEDLSMEFYNYTLPRMSRGR